MGTHQQQQWGHEMKRKQRERWDNWEREQCDNGTITRTEHIAKRWGEMARDTQLHVNYARTMERIDAKQRELLRREIDARVYKFCRVNNVSFDECINENNRAVYAHTVATLEHKR